MKKILMQYKLFLALLLGPLLVAACTAKELSENESGNFFKRLFSKNTYKIYRINIQQGNEISTENFKRLEKGLTKEQVRYLLGDSLTPTLFRKNRWDYSYYYISGGSKKRKRLSFSVFFENDKVIEICQHRHGSLVC